MKDFSTFTDSKNNDSQKIDANAYQTLKDLAGKYEGASESQMLIAIMQEATKARANGTLTDSDIDNFVSTLSPMLNGRQKKQLLHVAEQLKRK